MQDNKKLFLGILAGLAAGILWGFVFLAPQVLSDFSPLEIAYGRFFFSGLFSMVYLMPALRILKRISPKDVITVAGLSAAGFWLYTIFLVWSIQYNGGILTTLVIGLLPITISVADKNGRGLQGQFIAGLVSIFLGLLVLKGIPFIKEHQSLQDFSAKGAALLLSCLALWTWYGINSSFLKQNAWISKRDFTSLIGIISLLCMTLICFFLLDFHHLAGHQRFGVYTLWSVVLGVGSTWVAYWLWNFCSACCPPHISGPLIISETVFGVLFTLLHEGRLPSAPEFIGIAFFSFGAFLSIHSEIKKSG